jgi:uncharacterized repeat protein (TIGR03803 family)
MNFSELKRRLSIMTDQQALPTFALVCTLFTAIALALVLAQPASAQTETVLYNFCSATDCVDGAFPTGLIADTAGNLYGNTIYGGDTTDNGGVIFKLTPSGDESVLYSFHNGVPRDGYWPGSQPTMDAQGNLYGTTERGGSHSLHVEHGDGTAFKVSPDGTETTLYNFGANRTDGVEPFSGMVRDASGNLYGTTYIGGVYAAGTVFRLTPAGVETVLHNFANNATDGGYPFASLIIDTNGNLYGMTPSGGSAGGGTVFELTAAGSYQILYSFAGAGDGAIPIAGLTFDGQGNLYGTTSRANATCCTNHYQGTVFKLAPGANGSWQETVLYNFIQQGDSCQQPMSNIVFDGHGNLYGTTNQGGASKGGCLFELGPAGKLTVLHAFGEGTDGAGPAGNLLFSKGNLYGITGTGGAFAAGTVFKFTPEK